jgi:hypothetical protein
MFYVVGGVYTDMDFKTVVPGTEEEYGPFRTEDEAVKAWKAHAMAKIDNCFHRLSVVQREGERAA